MTNFLKTFYDKTSGEVVIFLISFVKCYILLGIKRKPGGRGRESSKRSAIIQLINVTTPYSPLRLSILSSNQNRNKVCKFPKIVRKDQ